MPYAKLPFLAPTMERDTLALLVLFHQRFANEVTQENEL